METKMQSFARYQQHNCTAKQAGFMPSYWATINSLLSLNDRTPETGVREDLM